MECPACGSDCVQSAPEILRDLPVKFLPCKKCSMRILDKRKPLPLPEYGQPCSCGKRFIDEVFAHMYVIMQEEGDLTSHDPLIAVGSPLIHPGMVMDRPPFLPAKSLILLSGKVHEKAAAGSFVRFLKYGVSSKPQLISPVLSHLTPTKLLKYIHCLPVAMSGPTFTRLPPVLLSFTSSSLVSM